MSLWTPEPTSGDELGDLATVDYADLLAALRKDLQLDAATDLLAGSLLLALGIKLGTTTLTWATSSADQSATVTHGLTDPSGRALVPVRVLVPNIVHPGVRGYTAFTGSYTSTTFVLLGRPDGVANETITFPWLAMSQ